MVSKESEAVTDSPAGGQAEWFRAAGLAEQRLPRAENSGVDHQPQLVDDVVLRTWLYKIATNRCLNALRSVRRRTAKQWDVPDVVPPEPTRHGEVIWLQPYPSALHDAAGSAQPGPEARYETAEAISLAFVTALQVLPPRQVAVLPPAVGSPAEDAIVARFVTAYESADVETLVALLTDDVFISMPPLPFEYEGRDAVTRFFTTMLGSGRSVSFLPARAKVSRRSAPTGALLPASAMGPAFSS